MLFGENVFMCSIQKDIPSILNDGSEFEVSFGGLKENVLGKSALKNLINFGVVPERSKFVELINNDDDSSDIVYCIKKHFDNLKKEYIVYKKVTLPFDALCSKNSLKSYIVESIKEDPYIGTNNYDVDVICKDDGVVKDEDICNSLKEAVNFISSVGVLPFIGGGSICNKVYLRIGGSTFIFCLMEDVKRDFIVIPLDVSSDGIRDYLQKTTLLCEEGIKDIVTYFKKKEGSYGQ